MDPVYDSTTGNYYDPSTGQNTAPPTAAQVQAQQDAQNGIDPNNSVSQMKFAQTPGAPQQDDQPAQSQSPLQPSYIPTPPTGQATTYDPALTGSTGYAAETYHNSYDPATATKELTDAAGVENRRQNQSLMSMLAAQGISPGSSAAQAAMQNLSGTQTAALAPSLASAQEFGAGLDSQAGLAGAAAKNTAGQFGAGASNTARLSNQSAKNVAGQYGAGANNQMTLQNLQDLLQSQEFNSTAFNNATSQQAGFENTDWLAQLQAQLGLQGQGLQTSGSLAGQQANQQVPINPSLFSQIAGGASAAAPFLAA